MMALIFFRNGVEVSQAGPYAAKSGRSGEGTASYFSEILLAKFPPGALLDAGERHGCSHE